MKKALSVFPFSVLPILLLTACSGDAPPPTTALDDMPVFTIRATGDIETPVPMVDASFVPNNVASWASQIILLSDGGDIWRTNSDGERPLLISKGTYRDVHGLTRDNSSGVFLAALPDGRASAFVERDDIGNFKPMTVSQGSFGIKTFCNGGGEQVGFIDMDGNLQTLTATFNDDISVELAPTAFSEPPAPLFTCSFDANGDVFATSEIKNKLHTYTLTDKTWQSYTGDIKTRNLTWLQVEDIDLGLGLSPDSTAMTLLTENIASRLMIEDGLSIRGLENTSFVAGTDAPMGSAYNEGIILMGDANTDRIVLLSLDYAGRVLAAR